MCQGFLDRRLDSGTPAPLAWTARRPSGWDRPRCAPNSARRGLSFSGAAAFQPSVIRLFLADDRPVVLGGGKRILPQFPGIRVVGDGTPREGLIAKVRAGAGDM